MRAFLHDCLHAVTLSAGFELLAIGMFILMLMVAP